MARNRRVLRGKGPSWNRGCFLPPFPCRARVAGEHPSVALPSRRGRRSARIRTPTQPHFGCWMETKAMAGLVRTGTAWQTGQEGAGRQVGGGKAGQGRPGQCHQGSRGRQSRKGQAARQGRSAGQTRQGWVVRAVQMGPPGLGRVGRHGMQARQASRAGT